MKGLEHGSSIITTDFDIQILSFSKLWISSLQIPQFDSSEYSRYQQLVFSYGNPGLCHEGLASSPGRFNVTLGFANRMWYHIYYLGWASTKKDLTSYVGENRDTASSCQAVTLIRPNSTSIQLRISWPWLYWPQAILACRCGFSPFLWISRVPYLVHWGAFISDRFWGH